MPAFGPLISNSRHPLWLTGCKWYAFLAVPLCPLVATVAHTFYCPSGHRLATATIILPPLEPSVGNGRHTLYHRLAHRSATAGFHCTTARPIGCQHYLYIAIVPQLG